MSSDMTLSFLKGSMLHPPFHGATSGNFMLDLLSAVYPFGDTSSLRRSGTHVQLFSLILPANFLMTGVYRAPLGYSVL